MSASESAKQSYILREQRCSELQQRKKQLAQRSDVVNSKAATCFSYIPTVLTNALQVHNGQGIWGLGSKHWPNNEALYQYSEEPGGLQSMGSLRVGHD